MSIGFTTLSRTPAAKEALDLFESYCWDNNIDPDAGMYSVTFYPSTVDDKRRYTQWVKVIHVDKDIDELVGSLVFYEDETKFSYIDPTKQIEWSVPKDTEENLRSFETFLGLTRVYAPWSDVEVANITKFQDNHLVHPFTCGNKRKSDSRIIQWIHRLSHWNKLRVTKERLICDVPFCNYEQFWVYSHMTNEMESV